MKAMQTVQDDRNDLSARLLSDVIEMYPELDGGMVADHLHTQQAVRGTPSTPEYRDTPFAIAFILHLFVVGFLALFWGLGSLKQDETITVLDDGPSEDTLSLCGMYFLLFLICCTGIGISAASLEFMTHHTEQLIQLTLIVSCIVMGLVVVSLFNNEAPVLGFCGLFMLICTILYSYTMQRRIPFAAANLQTALSAVQANYGLCLVAYAVAVANFAWVMVWLLAVLGVAFRASSCVDGTCNMHVSPLSLFMLVMSFFWTSQVLQVRLVPLCGDGVLY